MTIIDFLYQIVSVKKKDSYPN